MRVLWYIVLALVLVSPAQAQHEKPLGLTVLGTSTVPGGWIGFCERNPQECWVAWAKPRSVVLTKKVWQQILTINALVNSAIEPMSDPQQWGLIEHWSYPISGKGDCEDYVLEKRRLLMKAGFPRQALLITIVAERAGGAHAVLTVKTNKGEYILDNQTHDVLLWTDTFYRYLKRQSNHDPNIWVGLGDPRVVAGTIN